MVLDGHSAAVLLATKRRLGLIRTQLLEAMNDEAGVLGQDVAVKWTLLREAFAALEAAVAAVTPVGAPYLSELGHHQ